MATYIELFGLRNHSELRNKVMVACILAGEGIMVEDSGTTNHVNRLTWAASVFASPMAESSRMFMAILAANSDLTVEQIQSAMDAQIQTGVDNHIDLFATGG